MSWMWREYLQDEADVEGFKDIFTKDNKEWLDTGGHLTEEDLSESEVDTIISYFY